jgi:nitrogen fixation protein FixH
MSVRSPGRNRLWIPLLALAPLVALVLADMVMVTLAMRSDPGLVADASRRVGLARLSPATELRLELEVAPAAEGAALTLRLRDAAGHALPAALAEARLERTTHAGADRPVPLALRQDGAWAGIVTLPDAGAWQVSAAARDAEGRSALAILRLR